MNIKGIVFFIISAIALTLPARAATLYVGTHENLTTLQAGIDAAANGDTIVVRDGTYTGGGNRDVDFKGKAVTVCSENGPENCIIDCQGTAEEPHRGFTFQNDEDTDSILDGFTITGGFQNEGGALYCSYSSPTITNCRITDNCTSGINDFGGAICCDNSYAAITNCTVEDNKCINSNFGSAGISLNGGSPTITNCTVSGNFMNKTHMGGAGIYFQKSDVVIRNCKISGNGMSESYGYGCGSGGISFRSSNASLINCEITNNTAEDTASGGVYSDYATYEIVNCTIADNTGGVRSGKDPNNIIINSILWNRSYELGLDQCEVSFSCIAGGFAGDGNISAYPHFTDPELGDYHLLAWSPCVDAGSAEPDAGDTDRDGNARIANDTIDMGASEFQSTPSADADADGLPDLWETAMFGDTSAAASEDPDDDGFDNLTEYENGMTPLGPIAYVNAANTDDDQADGSVEHPYASIQTAVDSDADCIRVAGGTYAESIAVYSRTIVIEGGYSPDFTERNPANYGSIINGEGADFVVSFIGSYNAILNGFRLINGDSGIYCESSSAEISNCILSDNSGGLHATVYCIGYSAVAITNCTIVGNDNGAAIYANPLTSSATISNCILRNRGKELSNCTATYSCIEGEAAGMGNIDGFPYFVDAENGDYRLLAWSPCINAGNNEAVSAGTGSLRRIANGVVDMGALEFQDAPSPDEDADGLPDLWEINYFFDTSAAPGEDPDRDRMDNLREYRIGSNPRGRTAYVNAANDEDPAADGTIGHPFPTILQAVNSDADTIHVTGGTYPEDIDTERTITILGGYSPDFSQVDFGRYESIVDSASFSENSFVFDGFTVNTAGIACSFSSAVITNITIPSTSSSGIYCYYSSVEIRNCTLDGLNAYQGGISCRSCPDLTIDQCTVTNCKSDNATGIYCWESFGKITNCKISGNSHRGIYESHGAVEISNCEVTGNTVAGEGGGIYSGGNSTIKNCTVTHNTAVTGAGIFSYGEVTNCTVAYNEASGGGGGIAAASSIANCRIIGNSAMFGGGISALERPSITNCLISGNSSSEYGGGICGSYSAMQISNCIITGNRAPNDGGGIYNYGSTIMPTLTNCIVRSNGKEYVNCSLTYCCIEGGAEGEGNFDADPLFAAPGYWDDNNTPNNSDDDVWVEGDYHLKSIAGRWDASANDGAGGYVHDTVTSYCIDRGTPDSESSGEPTPNGGRANIGLYGNTSEASLSPAAYTLTILYEGITNPAVSSSPSGISAGVYQIPAGVELSLTAAGQAEGALFASWKTPDGDVVIQNRTCQFTMVADVSLVAEYKAVTDLYVNDGIAEEGIAAGKPENSGISPQLPINSVGALLERYPEMGAGYTVHVSAGIYEDNFTLNADNSGVKIVGAGPDVTIIDGNQSGTVLTLDSLTEGEISGIQFTRGKSENGGGIYCDNSSPFITNCSFTKNEATACGGGFYLYRSSPTISNCTFTDNSAGDSGGALYIDQYNFPYDLIITSCRFEKNTVSDDGYGGAVAGISQKLMMSNCEFVENYAGFGGGVSYSCRSTYTTTLSVQNCIFAANSAVSGGALYLQTHFAISNCILIANSASAAGGEISITETGHAMVKSSIVWDNAPSRIENNGSINFYNCDILGSLTDGWDTALGTDMGGNIDTDPLFVDPGHWNDNGTPDDPTDDAWVMGDYHLKSELGRWDPTANDGEGGWVQDNATSMCIDRGTFSDNFDQEPTPNGDRINIGLYGNTPEASMSPGTYKLTIKADGVNYICLQEPVNACTETTLAYPPDAKVTLLVPWYKINDFFLRWKTPDGETLSQKAAYEFTITGDTTVVAEYGTAADFYVNDATAEDGFAAGDDSNGGLSPQQPMAGIQALLDRYTWIERGATIHVSAGIYTENINIELVQSGIAIEGAGPGKTIIDGGSVASCLSLESKVECTVSGLTFTNGKADDGGGIYCSGSNKAFVSNCAFVDNLAAHEGGGMYISGTEFSIQESSFERNQAKYAGGALYCSPRSSTAIRRCIFLDNIAINENNVNVGKGGAIDAYCYNGPTIANCIFNHNISSSGGAVYTEYSSAVITNCTFVANTALATLPPIGGGAIYSATVAPVIADNIFWNNRAMNGPQIKNVFCTPSITHCNIQGSGGSQSWDTALGTDAGGNIDADPLFADPGHWDDNGTPDDTSDDTWIHGDYHLKSQYGRWDPSANGGEGDWVVDDVTSPGIDAGAPDADFVNEPQPNFGRVNMGAYGNTAEASKSGWNIPGDANGDCKVNIIDLIYVRNRLNKNAESGDSLRADVNDDNKINIIDLIYVRNRLNNRCQ